MESVYTTEQINKINKKMHSIFFEKFSIIIDFFELKGTNKMKKTDIIKYKFINDNVIDDKYKNLNKIDDLDFMKYINNKYGTIGQCVFLFGWILGSGDLNSKKLDAIAKIGTYFGILVKLSRDFVNLENDINRAKNVSNNYVINNGIYNSFVLFDKNNPMDVSSDVLK